MVRIILLILSAIQATNLMAQHKIILTIDTLPSYHSAGSDIFIAGSFNGWNPKDSAYKFRKEGNDKYSIQLELAEGQYEFKLTRGSWETVECLKSGQDRSNRILNVTNYTSESLDVEEWRDRFPAKAKKSTASKNVHIVDSAFLIPQLNRTRKVWIYLPECYTTSKKKFPVLYLHDGQNIFDDATSFAGKWGVDEYFDSACGKGIEAIVVAIDNGGDKRMNEYSPYDLEKFGKGEGNEYVEFIVNTLKPYIDRHYRTAKNKENTAIAGSSMGGLISLYAVLKYPKVFGGAGIFSPSLWLSPKIFDDLEQLSSTVKSKLYFYIGKNEPAQMQSDVLKTVEKMTRVSKSKISAVIRTGGEHNETSWRNEFPAFYEWLIKTN